MKFCKLYLCLLVCSFGQLLSAQQTADRLHQMRVDLVYLASDYLEGRLIGTRGEELAAEYIARRFEELGLSPKGDEGSCYQSFPFKEMTNPHASSGGEGMEGKGKNVVALLDNKAANTIIIGAHYDHLGMGETGSRHKGEKAVHNGADDNASGVAALLDLAAYLSNSGLKGNNYLFIAFSGEELGLFGSKHFANNPTIDLSKANYML